MIEYCIAAYEQEAKDFSYKRYMADVVRLIGENLAVLAKGSYIASRWMDKQEPDEPLDGDAIALDIIKRAGLKLQENQDESV